MRLNLLTIFENMKDSFIISPQDEIWKNEPTLEGAILLNGSIFQQNYLYVVKIEDLPKRWVATDSVTMIILGKPEQDYFAGGQVNYFCVMDSSLPVVFNFILGVFRKYLLLEESLNRKLLDSAQPEEVCQCIYDFFEIPYIVFDDSLRILYTSPYTENLLDWEKDGFSGLNMVPAEFYTQIFLSLDKNNSMQIGSANFVKDDRLTYNVILSQDSSDSIKILFFERENTFTANIVSVISYVGKYIISSFAHASIRPRSTQSLSSLIISMLDGQKFSSSELSERLSKTNWENDDTYCCVVFTSQSSYKVFDYMNTLCLKIENQFSSCVVFSYKGYIIAIINMDKSACHIRDISSRIGIILRDSLLRAGISFKYWNFETTPIYYMQALAAYEIGILYSPTLWYYYFEDYALYYILHYGASIIPPRHLCHPALVHLYRYDQKNNTELLLTLETYLQNGCNAIETAKELYIHRNTFYQRMRKIYELEDINLDNHDEKLYLQMSNKLIEMYYYELDSEFTFPRE